MHRHDHEVPRSKRSQSLWHMDQAVQAGFVEVDDLARAGRWGDGGAFVELRCVQSRTGWDCDVSPRQVRAFLTVGPDGITGYRSAPEDGPLGWACDHGMGAVERHRHLLKVRARRAELAAQRAARAAEDARQGGLF